MAQQVLSKKRKSEECPQDRLKIVSADTSADPASTPSDCRPPSKRVLFLVSGRRFIHLATLAAAMTCQKSSCNEKLHLSDYAAERRYGLASVLHTVAFVDWATRSTLIVVSLNLISGTKAFR